MPKQRLQVYADNDVKRRIELAAAKQDMPVTEYCLNAILQQLADDEILEEEQITIAVKPQTDDALVSDLRRLQAQILERRAGYVIDIDRVLDLVHDGEG